MDILKDAMLGQGREYLLAMQDCFTKSEDVISVRDTTATAVDSALLTLFSRFKMPRVFHSDQGSNYESAILRCLCSSLCPVTIPKASPRRWNGRT